MPHTTTREIERAAALTEEEQAQLATAEENTLAGQARRLHQAICDLGAAIVKECPAIAAAVSWSRKRIERQAEKEKEASDRE